MKMAYFSNGTEGMIYEEKWCSRCVHAPTEDCECVVLQAHALYSYELCNEKGTPGKTILDMMIPMSDDGLFPEKCAMFLEKSK